MKKISKIKIFEKLGNWRISFLPNRKREKESANSLLKKAAGTTIIKIIEKKNTSVLFANFRTIWHTCANFMSVKRLDILCDLRDTGLEVIKYMTLFYRAKPCPFSRFRWREQAVVQIQHCIIAEQLQISLKYGKSIRFFKQK